MHGPSPHLKYFGGPSPQPPLGLRTCLSGSQAERQGIQYLGLPKQIQQNDKVATIKRVQAKTRPRLQAKDKRQRQVKLMHCHIPHNKICTLTPLRAKSGRNALLTNSAIPNLDPSDDSGVFDILPLALDLSSSAVDDV